MQNYKTVDHLLLGEKYVKQKERKIVTLQSWVWAKLNKLYAQYAVLFSCLYSNPGASLCSVEVWRFV